MHGHEFVGFHFWWILPLLMFVFCIVMMILRRGPMSWRRGPMMCGFGYGRRYRYGAWSEYSAKDILEKRYANGEISREEYEDMSKVLASEQDEHTS